MGPTAIEASYIIVLGIVRSILPITSTLLQNGYLVCFKPAVNTEEEKQNKHCEPSQNNCVELIYIQTPFL
jgi:hypothetical protein